MILTANGVFAGYDTKRDIISDVSFSCGASEIIAVIGKNGCGKSTLLKALARQLKLSRGTITLDGTNIVELSQKQLAQKIAVLPQVRNVPSITAQALVMHGRFPYLSFPRIPTAKDKETVKDCMLATDTYQFKNTDVSLLSGGQRQRVYIAMLLAQQTDVVLLDEPTTFLDINCQLDTLKLIRSLREKGKSVITVLHDVSQAMQIADRILILDEGKNVFFGTPDELVCCNALQKYMNLLPHKVNVEGDTFYCFTQADKYEK